MNYIEEIFGTSIENYLSLSTVFFGNTVFEYIFAFLMFLFVFFVLRIFRAVILKKLSNIFYNTKSEFDSFIIGLIQNTPRYVYITISIYIPLKYLFLPDEIDITIDAIFLVVILLQFIRIATELVKFFLARTLLNEEDKDSLTTYNLLLVIARVVIWTTSLLFLLINLGFEITPLLASLGVGGIAVAFALQNILQDIFSSISIYLDKPFKIGDFIAVNGNFGTVEKIGIKTTRIRTLQGEQLVVSNQDMTTASVNNFGEMEKRRVVFEFGIVYETPVEKVKTAKEIVKNIFEEDDIKYYTELNRVHFKDFGDFSLNFEVVHTFNTSDFDIRMDVQENINIRIMEEFEKNNINFAYPTQVVYRK
ncbi:mechanosensitive ion channel family protein [Candidatus Absconditicoccus praedator]|uniref:mechanosensitive ion channel family protein n=1 Tax=Candidatus Absconditicoccus praedator TaxID=2735562 RepID=UPI001E3BB4EC|nr:mechanosensitive ion channel family protein [Candidatus Absconditicoccus praedator]UFX83376.1 mechanosensitive ion channel family protein [Candidatus Absconditicoccus praedator]